MSLPLALILEDAPKLAELYQTVLKQCQYETRIAEIFPDMAHDVMLEAGWEKVVKRVVDWFGTQGI